MTIGPSDPSALLSIVGTSSTTFSGSIRGRGLARARRRTLTLTLTGNWGSSDRRDLTLCNCDTGGLTISGGSLTVTGLGLGTMVEGGTLAVINGGTLQTGPLAGGNSDLLVAANMLVSGAGSTRDRERRIPASAFSGPTSLTIAMVACSTSQGGAEIDSGIPIFGTSTVTVTGPGLDLERRRPGLSGRRRRAPAAPGVSRFPTAVLSTPADS